MAYLAMSKTFKVFQIFQKQALQIGNASAARSYALYANFVDR